MKEKCTKTLVNMVKTFYFTNKFSMSVNTPNMISTGWFWTVKWFRQAKTVILARLVPPFIESYEGVFVVSI